MPARHPPPSTPAGLRSFQLHLPAARNLRASAVWAWERGAGGGGRGRRLATPSGHEARRCPVLRQNHFAGKITFFFFFSLPFFFVFYFSFAFVFFSSCARARVATALICRGLILVRIFFISIPFLPYMYRPTHFFFYLPYLFPS